MGIFTLTISILFWGILTPLVFFGGIITIDTAIITISVIRRPDISKKAKFVLVLVLMYNIWVEVWNVRQMWRLYRQYPSEILGFDKTSRMSAVFSKDFIEGVIDKSGISGAFKSVLEAISNFRFPDLDIDIDRDVVNAIIRILIAIAAAFTALIEYIFSLFP